MEHKDKFSHYELAKELEIPIAKGKVVFFDDVVDYADQLVFPVYISGRINVGGFNSVVAHVPGDFYHKHQEINDHYLVTKYIPNCRTLSISGVISKNQVFISSFHDKIVDGSQFVEAIFPMFIDHRELHEIQEAIMYARRIGNAMRERGFRGICGWNFIFKPGEVYFTNFIPKPQCTSAFTEAALAFHFPTQASLTVLDVKAKAEMELPEDLKGLGFMPSQFSWSYTNKDYI
jgi:carbamoylphosphate synthase large subunit